MSKSLFIKLFICSMFVVILSSIFCLPTSHALGDVISSGSDFLSKGNDIDKTLNANELEKTSDYIYNTLLGIAIMVAIIVAMVLGIQFMVASADEKAKVKEAILPFVVGCIVVFGAFTIWKIAVNIGNNAETSVGGYSSPEETTEAAQGIISGQIDVRSLSDKELKDLYTSQYVDSDLHNWTTSDPRAGGKDKVMTLEQAINNLSEYKRKIYNEAKRRGLLKSDGIYLK